MPLYASVAGVARQLGVLQVGTFHERQGEQSLVTEPGALPAAWARVWGGQTELRRSGAANAGFDGSTYGVQAGQDIYADATRRDRLAARHACCTSCFAAESFKPSAIKMDRIVVQSIYCPYLPRAAF